MSLSGRVATAKCSGILAQRRGRMEEKVMERYLQFGRSRRTSSREGDLEGVPVNLLPYAPSIVYRMKLFSLY